eukprot:Opistho-2@21551
MGRQTQQRKQTRQQRQKNTRTGAHNKHTHAHAHTDGPVWIKQGEAVEVRHSNDPLPVVAQIRKHTRPAMRIVTRGTLLLPCLDEAAVPEVVLDDDVRDGSKHKLDVVRVRRACEVRVNLLLIATVHLLKLLLDEVLGSFDIRSGASILWEADGQRHLGDLLGKQIRLVEEEDDRCLEEPLAVADRIKQLDTLVHAVCRLIFGKHLVVSAQRGAENNRRHILKAVNPLLALRPLATDIEHPEEEALELKVRLNDASRLDTRAQDILLSWHVIRRRNPIKAVKIVFCRVVELEFGCAGKALLDAAVCPEALDGRRKLIIERDTVEVVAVAEHLLGIGLAVIAAVRDFERLHGGDKCLHRLNRVAVHNVLELDALILGVALLVDDLHLLDNGTLARLTGAKQQQLDLSRHLPLIVLELLLDGLVAVERRLIFRAL